MTDLVDVADLTVGQVFELRRKIASSGKQWPPAKLQAMVDALKVIKADVVAASKALPEPIDCGPELFPSRTREEIAEAVALRIIETPGITGEYAKALVLMALDEAASAERADAEVA